MSSALTPLGHLVAGETAYINLHLSNTPNKVLWHFRRSTLLEWWMGKLIPNHITMHRKCPHDFYLIGGGWDRYKHGVFKSMATSPYQQGINKKAFWHFRRTLIGPNGGWRNCSRQAMALGQTPWLTPPQLSPKICLVHCQMLQIGLKDFQFSKCSGEGPHIPVNCF